jgi:hypothetical protein
LLKTVPAIGGNAKNLAPVTNGRGGTWNREDVILFTPDYFTVIQRISAAGGNPTDATTLDLSRGDRTHRFPSFLPDGRHFLFMSQDTRTTYSRSTLQIGSLDPSDREFPKVLFETDSNVVYSQGYLLYLRGGALVARPFDLDRLMLTGDPQPIVNGVLDVRITSCGVFSVAENGLLVYQTGSAPSDHVSLVWVDQNGHELGTVAADAGAAQSLTLSPNGRKAILSVRSPTNRGSDLWVYDLTSGEKDPLTTTDGMKRVNVWTTDSEVVIFQSPRNGTSGTFDLFVKPVNGGRPDSLYTDSQDKIPTSLSPDGQFLMYATPSPETRLYSDLWVRKIEKIDNSLRAEAHQNPVAFMRSAPYRVYFGQFSPDGLWVTYESDVGRLGMEIYAVPFPDQNPNKRVRVSRDGGTWARWRPDGHQILYVSPDGHLSSVDVTSTATTLDRHGWHELPVTFMSSNVGPTYDVARDGQLLMLRPASSQKATEPLTLYQNWMAGLKKR